MKVLSLFDGCSGARQALKDLHIRVGIYHAYEVDKYAIQIAHKNHPDIMSMGAITPETEIYWHYDLLIGGSPCQDLSIAKSNRKGLDGERSGLFWQYVRILKQCQPKYFLLENVASMSKESKQIITDTLGVEPILINSYLLTAQNRKRLYWTNIPGVTQPEDKGIMLKDIIEDGVVDRDKSYCLDANYHKGFPMSEEGRKRQGQRTCVKIGYIGNSDAQANRVYSPEGKSVTLSANGGGLGAKTGLYAIGCAKITRNGKGKNLEMRQDEKSNCITSVQTDSVVCEDYIIRKLTPVECERLQGYPDNYSAGVSNTQRYKMMGNSFTVPVIAHILGFMEGI